MSASSAPLAIAMMVLVLFFVVGLILIPILDEALARQIARIRGGVGRPRNDNDPEEARRA